MANSEGWIEKPAKRIQSRDAVDVRAGHDGERQQAQADGADEVAVGVQAAHVAHHQHGGDEEAGADQQPLALLEGEGGVDAIDLGESDRGQQGRQRQQIGVGLSEPAAHDQVQDEEEHDEDRTGRGSRRD